MDISKFRNSSSGRIIETQQGYWTFVPDKLPPGIDFTPELVEALSGADRAIGELAGVGRTLANPHLLIRPFVRREAVLSSRIEGTQASLSELFFFEASETEEKKGSDVREVANYVVALEYGINRLETLPISLRLIKELHQRLMQGVRGSHQTPGEFRRSQNWIGPPGCSLAEATFVPPPVAEMREALDNFEKYLHEKSALPPLANLAVIHYQFEAIHPFLDGNGRIGRLLLTLLLCQWGILPQPLLYLSAYFEKHRDEYYRLLLSVSQKGNWKSWIIYFLNGVTEPAEDAVARSRRLQDLQKAYRHKFQKSRSSSLLLGLVDYLFESPFLTVSRARDRLEVTFRSAQNNMDKLVAEGILREATGRARNRVFVAAEVLDAIEAPLGEAESKA